MTAQGTCIQSTCLYLCVELCLLSSIQQLKLQLRRFILPYLKEVWCLLYQVSNTVHSILGFGCLRYPKIRRFPSYLYEDKPSNTLWNLLEDNLGSGDVLEYVDDQELSIDVVCDFWS